MSAQPVDLVDPEDDRGGHAALDAQVTPAAPVTLTPVGHQRVDVHRRNADGGPTNGRSQTRPGDQRAPAAAPTSPVGHRPDDVQTRLADGGADTGRAIGSSKPSPAPPARADIRPAMPSATTKRHPPVGADPLDGQDTADAQNGGAVEGPFPAGMAIAIPTPNPAAPSLLDPTLLMAAQLVDDLMAARIANENRLRTFTTIEADSDGVVRGFGLDPSHPDVARLAAVTEGLHALEHQAVLNLNRSLRKHPLWPWIKAQRGAGEKTTARLLAAIGDPYINGATGAPRTVSQLWAYCGLHVLPADQPTSDTQSPLVGGATTSDPGQYHDDTHARLAGVAARRTKGQRANWSTAAKTLAYLTAEAMLKSGNREVYDARRARTAERVHSVACVRCGPAGKPAQPGSPWSKAHQHADALRIVSKGFLRDLWREARRLHLEDTP